MNGVGRWPCDTYGGVAACGGGGGGGGPSTPLLFFDLTPQVNGVVKVFSVPLHSLIIVIRNGVEEYPASVTHPSPTSIELQEIPETESSLGAGDGEKLWIYYNTP